VGKVVKDIRIPKSDVVFYKGSTTNLMVTLQFVYIWLKCSLYVVFWISEAGNLSAFKRDGKGY